MRTRTLLGMSWLGAATLAGALLLAPACASANTRVYLRVGPPAPIVEVQARRPGPQYVWVPGFYRWDRSAYVWAPGRWNLPPRLRAVWAPGHWQHHRRGWYWVDGRWR